jgi:hypothetical protein
MIFDTKAPFTLRLIFGTVSLFCRFLDYLNNSSPRTKKVVRVPILSVPYQTLSVVLTGLKSKIIKIGQ